MAALTGQYIRLSYKDLLQVSNSNSGIDATLRAVSDGEGTASILQLSSTAVNVAGTFQINGNSVAFSGSTYTFTGALTGNTTVTFPTTGTLSTLAGSETLTNKTITAPVLSGSVTGTYTLAGTPTISSPTITSPAISSPAISGTATMTGAFGNTSLRVLDTDASHALKIVPGSNITADRTFTITTGDADRTLTMGGNVTFSGAFNATFTLTAGTSVTLPTSGTLISSADTGTVTNTMLASTAVTASKVASNSGAGIPVQVAMGTFTTTGSIGAGYSDTGVTVSITPTSSSSKILVRAAMCVGGPSTDHIHLRLVRNSTPIGVGDTSSNRTLVTTAAQAQTGGELVSCILEWLDSPATTSATTYKVQGGTSAGNTAYINRSNTDTDSSAFSRGVSTITVMEIK